MIQAVDVHTTGLGGDSHVRGARMGSWRSARSADPAVPVGQRKPAHSARAARIGFRNPALLDYDLVEFLAPGRSARGLLDAQEQEILERVDGGPVQAAELVERTRIGSLARRRAAGLEARAARRAAFTPTDALHVLGVFERWEAEASRLAAAVLARRLGVSVIAFGELVVRQFSQQVATEVVNKVLEDEDGRPDWARRAGRPSAPGARLREQHPSTTPLRGSAQDASVAWADLRSAQDASVAWADLRSAQDWHPVAWADLRSDSRMHRAERPEGAQ